MSEIIRVRMQSVATVQRDRCRVRGDGNKQCWLHTGRAKGLTRIRSATAGESALGREGKVEFIESENAERPAVRLHRLG
jgi:hypothetical protein